MLTTDFHYHLPETLIAQKPIEPRDHSRLMVVDRKKKTTEHRHFFDIVNYLQSGDVLVWNNSKVFKARLFGKLMSPTGRELFEHKRDIEMFLVRPMENDGVWKVLAKPGKHVQPGNRVVFAEDFFCDVMVKEPDGTILVQFPLDQHAVREKANLYGSVPLPPYVKDEKHELEAYQTAYAKHEGSVAAPTAGFHFTPELIERLKEKGIIFAEVTLHVGLGTFLPVKAERVEDHTMHSEWVELTEETAMVINKAKQEGRRVIAVGTTTVRTLEGVAMLLGNLKSSIEKGTLRNDEGSLATSFDKGGLLRTYTGDINIFIKPGFEFNIIDAMITNFHLPKSTLLMLVSAFMHDREFALHCYRLAVDQEYRFYSFGDAMFIQ